MEELTTNDLVTLKQKWYLAKKLFELIEGDNSNIISKNIFFDHFYHVTQIGPPYEMRPYMKSWVDVCSKSAI